MEKERIKESYGPYWEYVKDHVDEEGWVECIKVPHMLDCYYEVNMNKQTEFQKGGSSPTGCSRWRPKELSND